MWTKFWTLMFLAVAMIAGAVMLTLRITEVDGRSPANFLARDILVDGSAGLGRLLSADTRYDLLKSAGYDQAGNPLNGPFHDQLISIVQPYPDLSLYKYVLGDDAVKTAILDAGGRSRSEMEDEIAARGLTPESVRTTLDSLGERPEIVDALMENTEVAADYFTQVVADTEGRHKQAKLRLHIAANRPVKILLNNVRRSQAFACASDGVLPTDMAPSDDARFPGSSYFNPRFEKVNGVEFAIFSMPPSSQPYAVQCALTPDVLHDSFSRRRLQISFFKPYEAMSNAREYDGRRLVFDPGSDEFRTYAPVSALHLTVSIAGATDMQFLGGKALLDSDYSDHERLLKPGGLTNIRWSDIARAQMRDVWLVVIGVLGAIGLMLLVEIIRPFADGQMKRTPKRRKAKAPARPRAMTLD